MKSGIRKLRLYGPEYAPKLEKIHEQMSPRNERLEREQAEASRTSWDATIAMGSSVLGAFLGRKARQQGRRITSGDSCQSRQRGQRNNAGVPARQ